MTVFARKKPVTIECMKFKNFNFGEVKKFCGDGKRFTFYVDAEHQRLSF